MSQFYTKDQIDQIASVIGTRIKENSSTRLEPAENILSFLDALDNGYIPTIPGSKIDPEWTIVEYNGITGNGFDGVGDVANYSMFKKTGLISSNNPSMTGGADGHLSAAYYTLQDGDVIRIDLGYHDAGEMFMSILGNAPDVAVFGESQKFHYPFGMITDEPSVDVTGSVYTLIYDGEFMIEYIDIETNSGVRSKYAYDPAPNESIFMEYSYIDGVVSVNINGITTIKLQPENRTVIVPIIDNAALASELGGVTSFTSKQIVSTDEPLVAPAWTIADEPDTRPIEELPTLVFVPRIDNEGLVSNLNLSVDIRKVDTWSLRDSSGLEIAGPESEFVNQSTYLFDDTLSDVNYKNINISIPEGTLSPGEVYTLYSNAAAMEIYSYGGVDGLDFISIPSSVISLKFTLGDRDFTVPDSIPSVLTNLSKLFYGSTVFNQDISGWDVSNATDMRYMFSGAESFNQDLSQWNTISTTDMSGMFESAYEFNSDISGWNVSNVKNISSMFSGARTFNQPIGNWNTSSVLEMYSLFYDAISFNQPLNNWDVSNVTSMKNLFYGAKAFDQPLNNWNMSKVEFLDGMFSNASLFNSDISTWDVSNVEGVTNMFRYTDTFNIDISSWNLINVKRFDRMFENALAFNQDLSQWCVVNSAVEPTDFARTTPSWVLPKPVWGTCPILENDVDSGSIVNLNTITNVSIPGVWSGLYDEAEFISEKDSNIVKSEILTALNEASTSIIEFEDLDFHSSTHYPWNEPPVHSMTVMGTKNPTTRKVIGILNVEYNVRLVDPIA